VFYDTDIDFEFMGMTRRNNDTADNRSPIDYAEIFETIRFTRKGRLFLARKVTSADMCLRRLVEPLKQFLKTYQDHAEQQSESFSKAF